MNDLKLCKRIAQGDEAVIEYVIDKYSRLVWHIAAAVIKDVGTAEDIEECVADAFVYLWNNPEKFESSKGTLKSWLSVIAKSRSIDKYRKLTKTVELDFDETILALCDADDEPIQQERQAALKEAMSMLSDIDSDIIRRRYYYEQKPREIAYALDIPVRKVNKRLYIAKQKLRDAIGNEKRRELL